MKTFLLCIAIVMFSGFAFGQLDQPIQYVTSNPVSPCVPGNRVQLNQTTPISVWGCGLDANWYKITGAGGASIVSTNNIIKGDGAGNGIALTTPAQCSGTQTSVGIAANGAANCEYPPQLQAQNDASGTYNNGMAIILGSGAAATANTSSSGLLQNWLVISGGGTSGTVTFAGSGIWPCQTDAAGATAQHWAIRSTATPGRCEDAGSTIPTGVWVIGQFQTGSAANANAMVSISGGFVGGAGGVSSFTGDGVLLNNSSSTGSVTATLANAAAHKFFGNNTGSGAAPGYESIGIGDLPSSLFTLTTTGSSGASTYSGGTLNIPQYSGGGGGASAAINLTDFNVAASGAVLTITLPVGGTNYGATGVVSNPGAIVATATGSGAWAPSTAGWWISWDIENQRFQLDTASGITATICGSSPCLTLSNLTQGSTMATGFPGNCFVPYANGTAGTVANTWSSSITNDIPFTGASTCLKVGGGLGQTIDTKGVMTVTGGGGGAVLPKTISYLFTATDAGTIFTANGSNLTDTLPATPPSMPWLIADHNLNATPLVIARNTNTINGLSANITLQQGDSTTCGSDTATGANYVCDLPKFGFTTLSFSGTPTFTYAAVINTFEITLTGNVTASSVAGAAPGQQSTFVICQDGTGSRTFAWPAAFKGAMTIGSTASKCNTQSFAFDGTSYFATSAGATNE